MSVIKVGGDVGEVESYEYNVCLEDLRGIAVFLKAYGIPKITGELNTVNIDQCYLDVPWYSRRRRHQTNHWVSEIIDMFRVCCLPSTVLSECRSFGFDGE